MSSFGQMEDRKILEKCKQHGEGNCYTAKEKMRRGLLENGKDKRNSF